jgi:hypothetical protein
MDCATGLSEFSSIFSRHFLIGFLAPTLAGLVVLSQLLSAQWLPNAYQDAPSATKVLIVTAAAIFFALLLSGLQYPLIRLLEGYPLQRLRDAPILRTVYWSRLERWRREFDGLTHALTKRAGPKRTRAAERLFSRFPARRESLLPTEFGNVLRSFETHPRRRYGLDGITIWPRIELLLDQEERNHVEQASSDLMFFVNGLYVIVLTGVTLAANAATQAASLPAGALRCSLVLAATLTVAALAWRASIDAGERWGSAVRAAFDLHRLELFERLGVAAPRTVNEDREIGRVVNRLLLYAEPVPERYRKIGGSTPAQRDVHEPGRTRLDRA